ncbi:SPOR domain-containing protein [Methylobacillus gramineus]|uniref:SPOR domain-containing protein n=1 Tax=Methylobacillus gramineus TaxID=755169 RepID=UPI001CFFC7DD|nr:SPOR domain-containing protein [Methylobacillus gramineus]MCB5184539.1 SPOR domain-containing protein [Methylobacillus gramineus]
MASDQTNEQELQFKKRARRRLVGAIALVLLMVTILPMVLDDRSAKVPPQEIAINIPSQDGPEFTSKVAPASEPTEEIVSEPILSSPQEDGESQDPEAAPVAIEPVKPAPGKPVEPATSKKEVAKPDSKPVASKAEVHKIEPAKPTVEKAPTPKPVAGGSFLIQIGVFSDPINVKNLQDKLSGQGLKSHTETIPTASGEKTRLRVGPFSSREAAEQALGKVKVAGLSGMVISNK